MTCVWVNDILSVIEEEKEVVGVDFKEPKYTSIASKKEHNLDEQFRSQFLVREEKLLYLQWLDHLDKSSKTTLPG